MGRLAAWEGNCLKTWREFSHPVKLEASVISFSRAMENTGRFWAGNLKTKNCVPRNCMPASSPAEEKQPN